MEHAEHAGIKALREAAAKAEKDLQEIRELLDIALKRNNGGGSIALATIVESQQKSSQRDEKKKLVSIGGKQLRNKIVDTIQQSGRFLHTREISEYLDNQSLEFSPAALTAQLAALRKEGIIRRVQYEASFNHFYYGLEDTMVSHDLAGHISYINDNVRPLAVVHGQVDPRTVEWNFDGSLSK